jgi:hypothetical protein
MSWYKTEVTKGQITDGKVIQIRTGFAAICESEKAWENAALYSKNHKEANGQALSSLFRNAHA